MTLASRTFTRCRDCKRAMSSARPRIPKGFVRYGAYGRCQMCDARLVRAGQPRHTTPPGRVPVRASESDAWPNKP